MSKDFGKRNIKEATDLISVKTPLTDCKAKLTHTHTHTKKKIKRKEMGFSCGKMSGHKSVEFGLGGTGSRNLVQQHT